MNEMTDAEIANEKAELNAWVATEVMGWKKRACHCGQAGCDVRAGWENIDGKKVHSFQTFRPTEILEQAMEGVEIYNITAHPFKQVFFSSWWCQSEKRTVYRICVGGSKGEYVHPARTKILLPDLAYQIVKTIKEQSNGI